MIDTLPPPGEVAGGVDTQPRTDPAGQGADSANDLWGRIRHQLLRPHAAIAAGVALVLAYWYVHHAFDVSLGETWATLRRAHPMFLLLGAVVFYLVYLVRAARWRVLLANVGFSRRTGYAMPPLRGLVRLMVVAAFANSVTVAQLGDAYRAYLLKKEAGVSFAATLGTILAERLIDVVVLVAMLALAGLTAFAGQLPREATDLLVAGLGLAGIGVVGLMSLRRLRRVVERLVPARWHAIYQRFEAGTLASFRRIPELLLYSVAGWLIEGATIYLLARAVAAPLSPSGALVAGLVASLLSVEPFTPGGLGATEAGIVLVLSALGVSPDIAAAVAVLNRLVNYLSLAVVGPLVYVAPKLRAGIARKVAIGDSAEEAGAGLTLLPPLHWRMERGPGGEAAGLGPEQSSTEE